MQTCMGDNVNFLSRTCSLRGKMLYKNAEHRETSAREKPERHFSAKVKQFTAEGSVVELIFVELVIMSGKN